MQEELLGRINRLEETVQELNDQLATGINIIMTS